MHLCAFTILTNSHQPKPFNHSAPQSLYSIRQIVGLYNAGKPKREIMDEYDLGKSTVERWVESINATGSPRAADNRTSEQNRILELERESRRLRMEADVLKRAAPIYARK